MHLGWFITTPLAPAVAVRVVIVLRATRVGVPTRLCANVLITLLACAELGVQLYVWGVTAVVAGARGFIVSGGAAHAHMIPQISW